MAKISLFILIFLLFIFASICEADIEISVRGSYSSYWDYYGDGFFFHTFSMDTVGPNTVLDFNRIIRTDHIGNPRSGFRFCKTRASLCIWLRDINGSNILSETA